MRTRTDSTHGSPDPLITEMLDSWRPGKDYQTEAIRLAGEVLQHSKLPVAEVKTLIVQARPPREADLWDGVFLRYTDRPYSLPSPLPPLKFVDANFHLRCKRIDSCLQVNTLKAAHEANRPKFRSIFGLTDVPTNQQHLVSLARPDEGRYLANYLGIPPLQLLTLKTGASIRYENKQFSRLRFDSSLLGEMRRHVAKYKGLTQMSGGSVTILGHFRRDSEQRIQCGFLRADEFAGLFGEHWRPRVLNLFFCGSEPFAVECAKILAPHRATINYVLDGEEVNLYRLDPQLGDTEEQSSSSILYYGGPDVTKYGNQGKLFGEAQGDALHLFRCLEVGQVAESKQQKSVAEKS